MALSARRTTILVGEPGPVRHYPVKANVKPIAGGLAVLSAGYAAPGTTALNLIALGMFEATVDNTGGANGALSVDVREGSYKWKNSAAGDQITQADVGKDVFIVDDETVAKTDGGGTRSRAGKCTKVDTEGVTVLMGLNV
jgi:hypothetical protein